MTSMWRRLLQPFWVLLAIIFLIEAWLWDHLEPIVARVVAPIPLFPLKLLVLWLLAHEYWLSAAFIILFAKFVGVGVTAFIFDVTRDKLLEMRWFEATYDFILRLRARATALVAPIKQRIREMLTGDGDGWSSRILRLIQRFRKSVHEAR